MPTPYSKVEAIEAACAEKYYRENIDWRREMIQTIETTKARVLAEAAERAVACVFSEEYGEITRAETQESMLRAAILDGQSARDAGKVVEALRKCAAVLAGDTTKNKLIEALEAARAVLAEYQTHPLTKP